MPAAQASAVDEVVVHERGRVHQLDRHGGAHEPLLPPNRARRTARGLGRHQHQQRTQALSACPDRGAGMARERLARARGHALEVKLGAGHALAQLRPAAAHDRLHPVNVRAARGRASSRARHGAPAPTVPTWIEMMLPAMST